MRIPADPGGRSGVIRALVPEDVGSVGANGSSGHVVAASLGHRSEATTLRSYADPTAVENARRRRALSVLEGGKAAS